MKGCVYNYIRSIRFFTSHQVRSHLVYIYSFPFFPHYFLIPLVILISISTRLFPSKATPALVAFYISIYHFFDIYTPVYIYTHTHTHIYPPNYKYLSSILLAVTIAIVTSCTNKHIKTTTPFSTPSSFTMAKYHINCCGNSNSTSNKTSITTNTVARLKTNEQESPALVNYANGVCEHSTLHDCRYAAQTNSSLCTMCAVGQCS